MHNSGYICNYSVFLITFIKVLFDMDLEMKERKVYSEIRQKMQCHLVLVINSSKSFITFSYFRITGFLDNWPKLEKWFTKFGSLQKVDASQEEKTVQLEVEKILEDTLNKVCSRQQEGQVNYTSIHSYLYTCKQSLIAVCRSYHKVAWSVSKSLQGKHFPIL